MTKNSILAAVLISVFAFQACTPPYKIDDRASKNLNAPSPVLKASDKILVVMPKDGKYKKNIYPKSGAQTAQKLNAALRAYTENITVTQEHMSFEEAKAYAGQKGFSHIFYPEITNWEDRVSAVSGLRDRVTVHMTVFNVTAAKTVNECLIYGNGSSNIWATAKTPEILLDKPFGIYVSSLFGADKTKK